MKIRIVNNEMYEIMQQFDYCGVEEHYILRKDFVVLFNQSSRNILYTVDDVNQCIETIKNDRYSVDMKVANLEHFELIRYYMENYNRNLLLDKLIDNSDVLDLTGIDS